MKAHITFEMEEIDLGPIETVKKKNTGWWSENWSEVMLITGLTVGIILLLSSVGVI